MTPEAPQNLPTQEQICSEHNERARWQCGVCGKPICKTCKPIALNYQVYHRACIQQAHKMIEKQTETHDEVDAPSNGLKIIAWCFIILGIVAFGIALLTLGFALFSKAIPIRGLMSGTIPTSLDSIAGARTLLNWLSGLSLVTSIIITVIGIGLLNCVAAARYAALSLAWMEIVVAVFAWAVILLLGEGFWDIPVVGVLLVWYFLRKNVRRQFEKVL